MKYTTNYNFKKPDQTDAYNIQNENDNMDLIDTTLKTTVDNVNSLVSTTVQNVNTQLATTVQNVNASLAETTENVDEKLEEALETLEETIENAEQILEGKVDEKIATHTANRNNPHGVTLAQVLGGGGSSVIPVNNGGTGNSSVDSTPTSGSSKMVTSDGIYRALQNLTPTTHYHSASDITSGTLTVARGGTGRSSKTTSSNDYEYRAIKIQSSIPSSVDTGCVVLVTI